MNEWHTFLTSEGAQWNQTTLTAFDTNNSSATCWLTPMTEHTLITVTGPDAVQYLQGQLTCDLRQLDEGKILIGAHCNPKGRMISSAVLASTAENSITLRVRANLAEKALEALKKYIVFSKASIEVSPQVPIAVLTNASLPETAEPTPETGHFATTNEYTQLVHTSGFHEYWVSDKYREALWQQLKTLAIPVAPQKLEDHLVKAGIAEVTQQTSEEFIPQMLNYDAIGAVSFKKGCYTGQEIIARLQYRGQSKKRTYLLEHNSTAPLSIGTHISQASAPDKPIGSIVACGENTLLATLNTECYEQKAQLHTIDSAAIILKWVPQPYAIP